MFYSSKFNKLKGIKHCFFSRKGGFSKGLYKSLNCGRGSKDSKKKISNNLRLIAKKMQIESKKLVLMHQTHSNRVLEITKRNLKKKIYSDAIITRERKIALGVVTADCVPILIYDLENNIVGCIHAGWKGAINGIVENTILKIKKLNKKNKIFASIGPCIGVKNYEVDLNFFNKFVSRSKKNSIYFLNKNKFKKLFNLRKFIADKLIQYKVKIDHVNHDTFKEKDNFFSYRRSVILKQKDYGRCISVIRLS